MPVPLFKFFGVSECIDYFNLSVLHEPDMYFFANPLSAFVILNWEIINYSK